MRWLSQAIVPVTPSIGLATRAPDTLTLHDFVWLSAPDSHQGA